MKLLLDTHLLLWAASGDARLSRRAAELINDRQCDLAFSVVSLWEIVIKNSLGRDDFRANPSLLRYRMLENGYDELLISSEHVLAVSGLPDHHKDPFDRLLVAQSTVERMTLLTADAVVASYVGPILLV